MPSSAPSEIEVDGGSESENLITTPGGGEAAQPEQVEKDDVPAALLHLVLEGCYLVLVTAAVLTVTPPRDEGVGESPYPGMMWVVPVVGGMLMGAAASAEVLGCCCVEPAQGTAWYLLAVLAALGLGVVDLVGHVRALSFCRVHPEDAWCVGVATGSGSVALVEESSLDPPEDRLVEWVDERPHRVWGRWMVAVSVGVLILARAAALANGFRACRCAASSASASSAPSKLTRTDTGTPVALKDGLEQSDELHLTASAAMDDPSTWNDFATPRDPR